jgi:hypothetical protein
MGSVTISVLVFLTTMTELSVGWFEIVSDSAEGMVFNY